MRGRPIVHRLPLERVDRAQTSRQTDGFIKIVATPSGKILGATIVAPAAGELANELSVAIACGVDLQRLASTMHVYPSKGSATEHSSLSVCRPHGTSLRSPRSCRPLTHRLAIESGRWGDTRSPVSPGSKPSSVRIARSGAPADHACGREAVGYWTGGLRGSRGKPVVEGFGGLDDGLRKHRRLLAKAVAADTFRDDPGVVRPDRAVVVLDRVVAV